MEINIEEINMEEIKKFIEEEKRALLEQQDTFIKKFINDFVETHPEYVQKFEIEHPGVDFKQSFEKMIREEWSQYEAPPMVDDNRIRESKPQPPVDPKSLYVVDDSQSTIDEYREKGVNVTKYTR